MGSDDHRGSMRNSISISSGINMQSVVINSKVVLIDWIGFH
jgi:hypothetical protein